MNEKNYNEHFMFTERNSWEGETWRFFIKLNEEDEAKLREALKIANDRSYELSERTYGKQEMEKFLRVPCRGYQKPYNVVKSYTIPTAETIDEFYKFKWLETEN